MLDSLRDYQENSIAAVQRSWDSGARNVLMVLPTGAGKTRTKSALIKRSQLPTCCIAHRQELVLQISESLASFGIFHNIVAPTDVVKFCVERHVKKFRRSFYAANSDVAVAGVRTLLTRQQTLTSFISRVQLWDIDEAHHVLPNNQWGQAASLFKNARGLGVTATPLRCDRKGLDGVFDDMVVGPTMRELIDRGYLSEYRIFCPPVSIDLDAVRISKSTHEFMADDLSNAVEKSQIVGDVVAHYQRICPGGRGLTFAVDMKSANKICNAFNEAGIPATVVNADTPDRIRTDMLDRLERGEIKQIVNVDLFGEGMDCPALDVVSMARPTQSYGLYCQQFGRVVRLFDGKKFGYVIDHVGNVIRHGLPDVYKEWSLAAPEGRRANKTDPDDLPLTTCRGCFQPYLRIKTCCPWCGLIPEPEGRSSPKEVDGDLVELDAETLAAMRKEVERVNGPPLIPQHLSPVAAKGLQNAWAARQTAQNALRDSIASWAGVRKYGHNETDREIQKRFYLSFGVDIMTAQTLNAADAAELKGRINEDWNSQRR